MRTVRIAELALKSAEAQLRLVRTNQARRVVRAYGQVLTAEQTHKQSQLKLDLAQYQARAFEERLRVGTSTPVDALNAQLAINTAQQELLRAEFTVRDARGALANLMGRNDLSESVLLPDMLSSLPNLAQLKELESQAPGVMFAQVNLETARLNAALTELQAWPSLKLGVGVVAERASANLSVGLQELTAQASVGYQVFGTFPNATPTFSLTLNMSLPLWDGGAAAANQSSAHLNVERTRLELEQANQDVLTQLTGALELSRLDDASIPPQQVALEAAQSALEATQARLAAGSVTPLEVLVARVQLSNAQGTLLSTQLRALENRYQIYAILGLGGLS